MNKCNKCDALGMIVDSISPHIAHSCECGYSEFLMRKEYAPSTLPDYLKKIGMNAAKRDLELVAMKEAEVKKILR